VKGHLIRHSWALPPAHPSILRTEGSRGKEEEQSMSKLTDTLVLLLLAAALLLLFIANAGKL